MTRPTYRIERGEAERKGQRRFVCHSANFYTHASKNLENANDIVTEVCVARDNWSTNSQLANWLARGETIQQSHKEFHT